MTDSSPRIDIRPDGPYRVGGGLPLLGMRPVKDAEGNRVEWERGPELRHDDTYELCRCGASATMPFCDGSEKEAGFDGTETADRAPYAERAWRYEAGPLVLTDDPRLCSSAAFCEAADADAWSLAEKADDPEVRERLFGMVSRCPSGRLVLMPPDGDGIEEELPQEIGVVKNGPYWVRGRIQVRSADGAEYEVRNRLTLCRCGASRNKPFCDGSHLRVHFHDQAPSSKLDSRSNP